MEQSVTLMLSTRSGLMAQAGLAGAV